MERSCEKRRVVGRTAAWHARGRHANMAEPRADEPLVAIPGLSQPDLKIMKDRTRTVV